MFRPHEEAVRQFSPRATDTKDSHSIISAARQLRTVQGSPSSLAIPDTLRRCANYSCFKKTHLCTQVAIRILFTLLICFVLIPYASICPALSKYFSIRRAASPVSTCYPDLGIPAASSSRQYGGHPCSLVSAPCACWHGRNLCSDAASQW